MSKLLTYFSMVALLALGACAHRQHESLSWDGHTILTNRSSIAALNALANNSASNRADRARAILTLFAQYIRPGSSAGEVHRVLTDLSWLDQAEVRGIYFLAGWVPVEMKGEDTAFFIDLFPDEDRRLGPWGITFELSGRPGDHTSLTKEEAHAFLKGDTSLLGTPRIV